MDRKSQLNTSEGGFRQLVERIDPKYRPVFDGRSEHETSALARYFLPQRSKKPTLAPTRPRVIKWYCPFAHQATFPSGHRYCINVFVGCAHRCRYCYAAGYEPENESGKKNFRRLLEKDLEDLERFDVPPAPCHLSNSTDPLQEALEERTEDTRFALQKLLEHRHRFSSVTLLSKNPARAARSEYIDLLLSLGELTDEHPARQSLSAVGQPPLQVEVSLASYREDARELYEPGAPPIEHRMDGVRSLSRGGVPVVLRIDPLFPRGVRYSDFDLVEPQRLEDLERLLDFAHQEGVRHVVYSPAKIVQPRGRRLSTVMAAMKAVYEAVAAPGRLVWRGGSFRLPAAVARDVVVTPFLDLCRKRGIKAKFCMQNLTETI